jgi:hypothetical protein
MQSETIRGVGASITLAGGAHHGCAALACRDLAIPWPAAKMFLLLRQ